MIMEVWKKHPNYDYEISTLGNVRNYKTKKVRKLRLTKDGYVSITLFKNQKLKTVLVHRLVCETFILNEQNKPAVNHKDKNRKNNCLNNLEWVTNSENQKHACQSLDNKFEKNNNSKVTFEIASLIRKDRTEGVKIKDICTKYKLSKTTIKNIIHNKGWTKPA